MAQEKTKKMAKPLVRGKVVEADPKGLRKHEIKKTGEVLRFKKSKHPEKEGAHLFHIHGKEVEGGLQMVTPAAQASITASIRARPDVPAGSVVSFATAKDFMN